METIDLSVPHMKSAHCQMAVQAAVTNSGAKIKSLFPSRIIVEVNGEREKNVVIDAIEKAGYKVDN